MKIAVLGLGMWGFSLARHLAINGHEIIGWTLDEKTATLLKEGKDHPTLHMPIGSLPIKIVPTLEEAIVDVSFILESATTKGLRPVLNSIKASSSYKNEPIVFTSKGIEQETFLTPPEIVQTVFGKEFLQNVAMVSGPSFAGEVAAGLPTAVSCGTTNADLAKLVISAFSSATFRIYPNTDILGVSLGGALKNVIAIACGISEGLALGVGARASLVTRGLHEMVKLANALGCKTETLYGLSGLGDLYLTCSSTQSRNFQFGKLISTGLTQKEAEEKIGMVVEGAHTCKAALGLSRKTHVTLPITEAVYNLLQGNISPIDVLKQLMQRNIKEEQL